VASQAAPQRQGGRDVIHWIALSYLTGLVLGFGIGLWFGYSVATDEKGKQHDIRP